MNRILKAVLWLTEALFHRKVLSYDWIRRHSLQRFPGKNNILYVLTSTCGRLGVLDLKQSLSLKKSGYCNVPPFCARSEFCRFWVGVILFAKKRLILFPECIHFWSVLQMHETFQNLIWDRGTRHKKVFLCIGEKLFLYKCFAHSASMIEHMYLFFIYKHSIFFFPMKNARLTCKNLWKYQFIPLLYTCPLKITFSQNISIQKLF